LRSAAQGCRQESAPRRAGRETKTDYELMSTARRNIVTALLAAAH
jgi:hypothetical protein